MELLLYGVPTIRLDKLTRPQLNKILLIPLLSKTKNSPHLLTMFICVKSYATQHECRVFAALADSIEAYSVDSSFTEPFLDQVLPRVRLEPTSVGSHIKPRQLQNTLV